MSHPFLEEINVESVIFDDAYESPRYTIAVWHTNDEAVLIYRSLRLHYRVSIPSSMWMKLSSDFIFMDQIEEVVMITTLLYKPYMDKIAVWTINDQLYSHLVDYFNIDCELLCTPYGSRLPYGSLFESDRLFGAIAHPFSILKTHSRVILNLYDPMIWDPVYRRLHCEKEFLVVVVTMGPLPPNTFIRYEEILHRVVLLDHRTGRRLTTSFLYVYVLSNRPMSSTLPTSLNEVAGIRRKQK